MNRIYIWMSAALLALGSCSTDKVLDKGDGLYLTVADINPVIKAEPGDTVVFKFVASTSGGVLDKVEITSGDGIRPLGDKTSFAFVDGELFLDEEGRFSRPVSSVLVLYPLVIPDNPELRGRHVSAELKVTRDDGKSIKLTQAFEILRYINNFQGVPIAGKGEVLLYNPTDDIVYDAENYKGHESSVDLVFYVDTASSPRYHCLNPAAPETEKVMRAFGYPDYDAREMNATRFMAAGTLDFAKADEEDLAALTLEEGQDWITLANNAIGKFVTSDGRKGLVKLQYKSPNRVFISKMQLKE